jgi:hypothetical protein
MAEAHTPHVPAPEDHEDQTVLSGPPRFGDGDAAGAGDVDDQFDDPALDTGDRKLWPPPSDFAANDPTRLEGGRPPGAMAPRFDDGFDGGGARARSAPLGDEGGPRPALPAGGGARARSAPLGDEGGPRPALPAGGGARARSAPVDDDDEDPTGTHPAAPRARVRDFAAPMEDELDPDDVRPTQRLRGAAIVPAALAGRNPTPAVSALSPRRQSRRTPAAVPLIHSPPDADLSGPVTDVKPRASSPASQPGRSTGPSPQPPPTPLSGPPSGRPLSFNQPSGPPPAPPLGPPSNQPSGPPPPPPSPAGPPAPPISAVPLAPLRPPLVAPPSGPVQTPQPPVDLPLSAPMDTPLPSRLPAAPPAPPAPQPWRDDASFALPDIDDPAYRLPRSDRKKLWLVIGGLVALVGITAIVVALATRGSGSTPSLGSMEVISLPAGAEVTVDGRARGTTPLVLESLPIGTSVKLELSLAKHDPWRREESIATSTRVKVIAQLKQIRGTLKVESRPSGAEVLLGNQSLGFTPLERTDLDPFVDGTLELRKQGFRPRREPLEWKGERSRVLLLDLEPAR